LSETREHLEKKLLVFWMCLIPIKKKFSSSSLSALNKTGKKIKKKVFKNPSFDWATIIKSEEFRLSKEQLCSFFLSFFNDHFSWQLPNFLHLVLFCATFIFTLEKQSMPHLFWFSGKTCWKYTSSFKLFANETFHS